MRLREVRLGPFDLVLEQRPDGTLRARSPHPLGDYPARLTERLEHWAAHGARAHLPRQARPGWRLAAADLRRNARGRAPPRPGAARPRALGRAPARDPLGQRPRARAAGARARSTSACPMPRSRPPTRWSRQDFGKLRDDPRSAHARAWSSPPPAARTGPRSTAAVAPATELVVTADPPAGRAATPFAELLATEPTERGRGGRGAGRPRHHRQVPVHLGLDRPAQGGDQHPAHAVQQSGDDRRDARLPRGRAAGHGRLAALAPHRRRQPQPRPRALQRRLAVHRRRQADDGRDRRDGAQPARDRDHLLRQRAQGLRGPAAASRATMRRCASASSAGCA